MKNIILVFIAILFGFITTTAQTVAFTNVNVIPMDKERVLKNQTVLIKDGIIAETGANVKIPKDAQIIDGSGKYLIPGLIDMHVHMLSDDDEYPDSIAEDELKVMVANGVTTVRFMIGTPEQLILRAKSANGEIIAPTIFAASPHLTGREQGNDFVVNTTEEAREAVRKSKAAGYDFIKITTFIKAEVYEAAVDEAAKQNIRVVGHADSRFVGLERALKAKQQIEHLDGYLEAVLKDDAPMKGSVSDLYIYNPKNWESIDYIDENKIPIIARKTVESNPFVDPTQSFMKNTFGLPRSEESIRAQPDFKFYPKKNQDFYINYMKRTPLNQVSWEKRARWVEIKNKIIKAIYDAGGKLMTGSDTPEFLWLYGFTEHRELKALVDAGLSNYAALEAATVNPALYLGNSDKVGTIEKGKRADLVLLDANPLENISATEKRAGVMLKGKYYTQAEMNKWLDEAAVKIHDSLPEDKAKNNDLQSVSEIPDKLFAAMKAENYDDIRALFTPEGQLVAIDKPRDGKGISKTRVFTAESFAKMISEAKGGDFIEKMLNKDVKISGDLAVVSGRYTFYAGDKLSHCGTNTFNLVKTETGWKIANAASTLEFQCERDLKTVEVPAKEADPKDVSTIDGIIKAFYETVSGGKGVPRQWSRDRTLYTPDIRFVGMSEQNGKIRATVMNHANYVNGTNEFFVAEGFTEKEIDRVVRRFGNIAHVFSVYESSTEDGKEKERGVNSIELFWDGTRWWISAVSWDEERAGNPIPKEFLPKGKK